MSASDLIDPESRGPLDALLAVLPGGFNTIPDIVARRAAHRELAAVAPVAHPDVRREDRTVPGPAGGPDLSVRIYRPSPAEGEPPGIYFVHGGGMIMGDVAGSDATAAMLAERVGAVVVSVEYRLAPEHPHPAPVEDCYAGLVWTVQHCMELGVDPARLALYGASAGGGLVIGTALLARDRGGPAVSFMMAIHPMIDDRHESPSSREITDVGSWDRAGNVEAWGWYLGGQQPDQYAAPTRASDLSGLPPAFVDVGTVDLFRDEDIDFAARLMQAGVPTELHVHPGSYHSSEAVAPEAALSKRIWAMRIDALRRALAPRA